MALLWQPSETTSLTLSAMRQEVDADNNAVLMQNSDGSPLGDRFNTNLIRDEPFDSTYDLYSAALNVGIGDVTLTSVTSYSEVDMLAMLDATRSYGDGALADSLRMSLTASARRS